MALVEVSPVPLISNLQTLKNKGIGGALFLYNFVSSVPSRLLPGLTLTPLVPPLS